MGLPIAGILYLGWVIGPSLRYGHSAPVFYWEGSFFSGFLDRPGGLLQWFAGLLAQTECLPWLGAGLMALLVVGLAAWLLRLNRAAPSAMSWVAAGLPGVLLVALAGRYEGTVWPALVIGLLSVGAVHLWQLTKCWPSALRALWFWVQTGALLYVGGYAAATLFVIVGVGREAFSRERLLWAVSYLLAGLLLPLGYAVAPTTAPASMLVGLGGGWSLWLTVAFFLTLTVALLLPEAQWAKSGADSGGQRSRGASIAGRLDAGRLLAGGVTLAALLLVVSLDLRLRSALRVQQAADDQDWDGVLRTVSRLSSYSEATRLQLHRALYHTGRLCDDLFAYPQRQGAALLPPAREAGLDACLPLSDTLLEIGHVNLAERYAYEALEIYGERPAILRRLARLSVAKNRPAAAGIFLNRMAMIPFRRAEAEVQLEALKADPLCAGDPILQRFREIQVRSAHADMQFATETLLDLATQGNPSNRMAFEYQVAHRLLKSQTEAVVRDLPRFRELGYPDLPRHVQELLLAVRPDSAETGSFAGWRLSTECVDRYARYRQAIRTGSDPGSLVREFGHTTWFYLQFGRSYRRRP